MIDFLAYHIQEAGRMALDAQAKLTAGDISFKGERDLVTSADKAVEKYLVDAIISSYPEHGIIGEESGSHGADASYCWIIDPIDGTTSYVHQQPYFSVSIGLRKDNTMIAGGVYAPALNQLFLAEKGGGATLNGAPITVSSCEKMIHAILATGFACLRKRSGADNLAVLAKLLPKISDIRRCGSAAIDLAYVAAGKYDGYWEHNLNLYDIAAGALLVTEAGGTVTDLRGNQDYPASGIIATNGAIHDIPCYCLILLQGVIV
jgi:myo-inositol-1(or 4)-monophosphatase